MKIMLTLLALCCLLTGNVYAATEYCEGHPEKIVNGRSNRNVFAILQEELNSFQRPENIFNDRYELCFSLRIDGEPIENLPFENNTKLTIQNNTGREVVIGFLKAKRTDDSPAPILEIFGKDVTVFAPELSGLRQGIVFHGEGHKLIGGTIRGKTDNTELACVQSQGDRMTARGIQFTDCPFGVEVRGNQAVVETIQIDFTPPAASSPELPEGNENLIAWKIAYEEWINNIPPRPSPALFLSGNNGILRNLRIEGFHGTGAKLLGNGHLIEGSQFLGEPVPLDLLASDEKKNLDESGQIDTLKMPRRSLNCLHIAKASNVLVENNHFTFCHEGILNTESQNIFIGPEAIQDFEARKNSLHDNDFAVHVKDSQQVFARHNTVFDNGWNGEATNALHFGLWVDNSNFFENLLLEAPVFHAVGENIDPDAKVVPVVVYDDGEKSPEGDETIKGTIRLMIGNAVGKVEIAFSPPNEEKKDEITKFQSFSPFTDCETRGETADCEVEITGEIIGKIVIATLHSNDAGSSSYTAIVGKINPRTGIPLSMPESTTGSIGGEALAAGPVVNAPHIETAHAGSGGGAPSVIGGGGSAGGGGAGGGKAGCSFIPGGEEQTLPPESLVFWCVLVGLMAALRQAQGERGVHVHRKRPIH